LSTPEDQTCCDSFMMRTSWWWLVDRKCQWLEISDEVEKHNIMWTE